MALYRKEIIEAEAIIGGRRMPYRVVYSQRARRLRITVSGNQVTVTLPAGVHLREAEKMLREHSTWLVSQLERSARSKTSAKGLPPDVLLLRGDAKKIEIHEEKGRQLRIRVDELQDRLILRVPEGTREPSRALAVPWFKALAREAFSESAVMWAQKMGVKFRSISVRDQKTRWGSCSSRGTLSFNWRLVMAPPAVLEYVVIHELAHLKQPNHSKAFWQLVSQYYPDHKQARAWLRTNSAKLRPNDLI